MKNLISNNLNAFAEIENRALLVFIWNPVNRNDLDAMTQGLNSGIGISRR